MINGNCEVASQTKREIYTTERRPRHVCYIVCRRLESGVKSWFCAEATPIPASLTATVAPTHNEKKRFR